jgi:hypothetical protein
LPLAAVRPAVAQGPATPDALQAARELVAILSTDTMKQLTAQVIAQIWPRLEGDLRAKRPSVTADQLNELKSEFQRIQYEFLMKSMEDAPAIYARYFTAQELREILAFYRTPVGEKSLKVMPQIMGETMAVLMPRMQDIQIQTMDAFSKVLKQRGFDL